MSDVPAKHTSGPFYVLDQRASHLRELGWTGPHQDAILISSKSPREVLDCAGEDCIVARIEFRNRDEELGESNLADGHLFAAAPDGLTFATDFLAYIDKSDTNDLDFGRGLASSGLVEQARAFVAKALTSEGADHG